MNSQIIREQISQLIESIIEQTETILKNKEKIPEIEIDIALSYIRELYKKYLELEKLNGTLAEPESIFASHGKTEIPKQEPVLRMNVEPMKKQEVQEVKPMAEPIVAQKIPEKSVVTEAPEVVESKPEIISTKEKTISETPSDLELFSDDSPKRIRPARELKKSIFEKAAENKNEKSIADRLHKQPITTLKSAIGINEKFLFINELFNGNMHEYNAFISKVDSFTSIDDAMSYLNQLKMNKPWNEEMPAYSKLNDLIERRFMS